MPRTFFVDYPSEFCAGQHLCAGVTTHAWSFVGVPPCGESLPSTVNVTMKNKQFSPSTIRVEPGANVVMCNEDTFPQFPYSPDKKDFGHKRIEQGKCITFKISKKSISSRATYTIYDERHIKMKLTIIELPNNC